MKNKDCYHHHFLATDQPQTCPSCGLRTEILADLIHTGSRTQIHLCPGQDCGSEFVGSMESAEETGILEHYIPINLLFCSFLSTFLYP